MLKSFYSPGLSPSEKPVPRESVESPGPEDGGVLGQSTFTWLLGNAKDFRTKPWSMDVHLAMFFSYYLQKSYLKLGRILLLPILKLSITLVNMGSDICSSYYEQK